MQTEQMQTTMQNDTASGLTARKAIGEEQARKAMDTLQKYRQGRAGGAGHCFGGLVAHAQLAADPEGKPGG